MDPLSFVLSVHRNFVRMQFNDDYDTEKYKNATDGINNRVQCVEVFGVWKGERMR